MRAAFLANSFHLQKTRSSDFFIDIARTTFDEVVVITSKEAWARIPGHTWDALIVWQETIAPDELDAFGIRNITLVPMYDDCPHERGFWLRYLPYKVFCFSRALQASLDQWGLRTMHARYYPPQQAAVDPMEGPPRAFFWPRRDDLGWDLVKRLIGFNKMAGVQFHWTPDIHPDVTVYPSPAELSEYRMDISTWTSDRHQYEKLVRRNNVFFAPRLSEGIGMSFLEALSWGLCVVAADRPTMNEYIAHGVNGILYDPDEPKPVDFARRVEMGRAAAESCREGRVEWEASLPAIKDFLREPLERYFPRKHPLIRLRGRSEALLRQLYRSWKKALRAIP